MMNNSGIVLYICAYLNAARHMVEVKAPLKVFKRIDYQATELSRRLRNENRVLTVRFPHNIIVKALTIDSA